MLEWLARKFIMISEEIRVIEENRSRKNFVWFGAEWRFCIHCDVVHSTKISPPLGKKKRKFIFKTMKETFKIRLNENSFGSQLLEGM